VINRQNSKLFTIPKQQDAISEVKGKGKIESGGRYSAADIRSALQYWKCRLIGISYFLQKTAA